MCHKSGDFKFHAPYYWFIGVFKISHKQKIYINKNKQK